MNLLFIKSVLVGAFLVSGTTYTITDKKLDVIAEEKHREEIAAKDSIIARQSIQLDSIKPPAMPSVVYIPHDTIIFHDSTVYRYKKKYLPVLVYDTMRPIDTQAVFNNYLKEHYKIGVKK